MSISNHHVVLSKIKEISFEDDCLPDESFLMSYFQSVGKLSFSNASSWKTEEKSTDIIFSNRTAFRFIWNYSQESRSKLIDSTLFFLGKPKVSREVKEDMIFIVDQIFSCLESGKDFETERVIASLNLFATNKRSHLIEYSKYKLTDSSLKSVWKESGMENSKDPEFFALLWSELKRSSGYVESQKKIISSCAKNCKSIPDSIVSSLSDGGYDSTKAWLVRHLCDIISWNKNQPLLDNKDAIDESLNTAYAQIISIVPNIKNTWEISADSLIDALPKEHLIWVAQQIRNCGSKYVVAKLEQKLSS